MPFRSILSLPDLVYGSIKNPFYSLLINKAYETQTPAGRQVYPLRVNASAGPSQPDPLSALILTPSLSSTT